MHYMLAIKKGKDYHEDLGVYKNPIQNLPPSDPMASVLLRKPKYPVRA